MINEDKRQLLKTAANRAGLLDVTLVAEPIAVLQHYCQKNKQQEDQIFLVYDFGGGTFDVALIRFEDNEMRVVDHEGDNYLGGLDFDNLIIEKLIVPGDAEIKENNRARSAKLRVAEKK